jgi:ABC-type dipeptide/oligopeptide/nickel transport system permease component
MTEYIIRRLLQSVIVILGVVFLVFLLMQLTGDPAALMLPPNSLPEDIERLRIIYGLDKPLYVQFARFLFGDFGTEPQEVQMSEKYKKADLPERVTVRPRQGVFRGDFGESFRFSNQSAFQIAMERFPYSIQLMLAAFGYAVFFSLFFGLIAALWRGSIVDQLVQIIANIGQAVPSFWLGLLLILIFAVNLRLLPAMGSGSWAHLILPAITLGSPSMARNTRLVRSGMLDVLGEDYIRTARAKGLAEAQIVAKHALKNIAIPLVTLWGLDIGVLFGGAVITESIFAWPGTGRLIIESVGVRDFPVVQASVTFIAFVFVTVNLFVDILYGWLDPRVRLGRR